MEKKVTGFFADFKAFALRGNVLDLAVGVMIGGAFGKIISSLVGDILTPIIGLITGGLDFAGLFIALDGNSYASVEAANAAGAGTLNYGAFLTAILDFFLMALCVFLVVRALARLMPEKKAPPPKEAPRLCPFCFTEVDKRATKCPHCTADIAGK